MPFSKLLGPMLCVTLFICIAIGNRQSSAAGAAQATADSSATVSRPCNAASTPAATPDATEVVMPTTSATMLATIAATEATTPDNTLIKLLSFEPTDIHFSPSPVKPIAVIIVFSLIFQNQLAEPLHIESPRFQLAIDDVVWGALSSTDFQTGQLPANGQQGIVLQSLTVANQATPAQAAILACLRDQQPVVLTLTGTINAFPGGVKQSIPLTFINSPIIVRARQSAAQ